MSDRKMALALSSGGARGAYEVGAMLYLAERGIRFDAVSGASIGALNAAYYAQGDGSPEAIQELAARWREVPSAGIIQVDASKAIALLASLIATQLPTFTRVLLALEIGKSGLLDPRPVKALLDKWIDYEAVRKSTTDLLVAVLEETDPLVDIAMHPWKKATYFRAADCSNAKLRSALLASAAIPFAFPSRKIDNRRYADAGLVDALPAGELYRRGHRRLVSVFLSDYTIQNRADFPGAIIMQIRPSENIDTGFTSCFDFSQESIERLIDMGYRDAKTCFGEAQDLFDDLVKLERLGKIEETLAKALPDRRQRERKELVQLLTDAQLEEKLAKALPDGHQRERKELVQLLTGAELGAAPYFEEQIAVEETNILRALEFKERIAVDATNPLRAAEISLRALRSRPLLRRIWEGFTGKGQDRIAALGQDLVVAQRASLAIIKTVMNESNRTKECMIRVTHNLLQVNAELDGLQNVAENLDKRITAMRKEFRVEFDRIYSEIEHAKDLARYLARREAEVRRLGDRFRANALHPGTGELFGASLYLAQRLRYFSGEAADEVEAERSSALAIIKDRLGNHVMPFSELVMEAVSNVDDKVLQATALVSEAAQGPMGRLLLSLLDRRLEGLTLDDQDVKEAIAVVRQFGDPDQKLGARLLRPVEFVEFLVEELEIQGRGDK